MSSTEAKAVPELAHVLPEVGTAAVVLVVYHLITGRRAVT
jgi:hypothetical protein